VLTIGGWLPLVVGWYRPVEALDFQTEIYISPKLAVTRHNFGF